MPHKILIIEDESKIARFVELELKHEGYDVTIELDGKLGLEKAITKEYDVIILDLMLPSISGIEICRRIRKKSNVPIIMLTAKDDISDKVMGLDVGANDYITKPFAIEELLARIRVVLRNQETLNNFDKSPITIGKILLDPIKYLVKYNEEVIDLSKKEFDLLEYLIKNKNIVLTRDKLLEKVWGYEYVGETNIIDVYIRYLRTKIDERFNDKYIYTVRGVGYQIKYE